MMMSRIAHKAWSLGCLSLALGVIPLMGCRALPARPAAECSTGPSPGTRAPDSAQRVVAASGTSYAAVPLPPNRGAGESSEKPATGESTVERQSPPASWTLSELEEMALVRHPSLAEQQARIEALVGKWLQAGLRPNTELGFSGQQLFSGGQAEQTGIFLGQRIVRQAKLDWSQSVVCREIETAGHQFEALRQRVLTDVKLAYLELLVAQRREEIAAELLSIADRNLTTVRALQRAGEASQVDVLRAQVEVQTAGVQRQNAANDRAAGWARLAVLVGEPAEPTCQVLGDLESPMEAVDPARLVARLVNESPQLLAAVADQHRAHAATHRAAVEALPDIHVQAIVQHDQAVDGTNANLQISFPLPWRDRNQGGIHQARYEEWAAALAVERLQQGLLQRLASVVQRYQNATNLVQEYGAPEGILARTQETLHAIERAFSAGEIGYLDLLTAQRLYAQTNLLYLEALGAQVASHAELEGLLLTGSYGD